MWRKGYEKGFWAPGGGLDLGLSSYVDVDVDADVDASTRKG